MRFAMAANPSVFDQTGSSFSAGPKTMLILLRLGSSTAWMYGRARTIFSIKRSSDYRNREQRAFSNEPSRTRNGAWHQRAVTELGIRG
jgi:hypothetical protein